MTNFFYFEGRIFEKEEDVKSYVKNFTCKKYDIIKSDKSFDEFEDAFDKAKAEGCSDFDALEWSK